MPHRDDDDQQSGRPVLKALFWGGIGLAPVAMLLLLFADGNGPLRIAAVLAVMSVVLIGLSIALRGDADAERAIGGAALAEEIDSLHSDVRKDITSAAQQTHRALMEQIRALQQQIDGLRDQLDGAGPRSRGGYEPAAPSIPNQYKPSTGQQYGTQGYSGGMYGAAPGHGGQSYGGGGHSRGAGQTYSGAGHTYGGAKSDRQSESRRSSEVVHTQTFQVTTSRHTYVGDRAEMSGNVYGASSEASGNIYGSSEASGNVYGGGRYAPDDPAEESWTDQRLREMRVGERRASAYSDGGNELHVQDRWASVRQEEPYDSWSESTSWPLHAANPAPALPQRSAEPVWSADPAAAWGQGWGDGEPAYESRQYDELPRAGRDDRWP